MNNIDLAVDRACVARIEEDAARIAYDTLRKGESIGMERVQVAVTVGPEALLFVCPISLIIDAASRAAVANAETKQGELLTLAKLLEPLIEVPGGLSVDTAKGEVEWLNKHLALKIEE